jgi:ABC-type transport system involved in cytochrome bd biosynthesis fused ATPase/permease subunit
MRLGAAVVLEVLTRLAVPVSLLALAGGHAEAALWAALAMNLLALGRSAVVGLHTERATHEVWGALVAAAQRHDAAARDAGRVAALIDAATQTALFRAQVLPQAISHAIALALTVAAVLAILGPGWLLAGAALGLALAPIVLLGQRRLRAWHATAFERFGEAAEALEVLLAATLELRAHHVERREAARTLAHVASMARAERRAGSLSTLLGMLPVGLALLLAVVPLRAGLLSLGDVESRLAEVGVLGATALMVLAGLVAAAEGVARTAPHRRAFADFVAAEGVPTAGHTEVSMRDATVRFEGVAMRYPGSDALTPAAVHAAWPPGVGLAVTGDNGAGKSTLALCTLGLLPPSSGHVRWGDVDARDARLGRTVLVTQHPFVAPAKSVGWHLRLFSEAQPDDAALEAALDQVGLLATLRRGSNAPLDVVAASLSGGERKRMHLARALLGDAELVIFDEPEAGLDEPSRRWLTNFLRDLCNQRRVMAIVHDRAVIPDDYASIVCRRAPAGGVAPDQGSGDTRIA